MANTLKFGNGEWYGKKDTILAYNDENSNYKPLPFDFSRASKATVINKDGLIETVGSGEPRIDYKDDSKGALLLEPSRTNVFPNSDGDLSTYSSQNGNVADASTPIDGFENSIEINLDSVESLGYKRSFTPTVGIEYTLSFFVQMNDNSEPIQSIDSNSGDFSLWINNSLASGASKIKTQRLGSSNIYRVSATHTATSTNNRFGIKKYPTQSSKGFRFASPQLEQGSYSTSLIKTQGSAVTRLADTCNNGGNDQVINSSEGVLYVEIAALANDGTTRAISINDGSANNFVQFAFRPSSNTIRYRLASGNVLQFSTGFVGSEATIFNKIALVYGSNNFALWVNGVRRFLRTDDSTPLNLSNIDFNDGINTSFLYGKTKDLRLYNTALTDSELAALTS